MSKALILDCDGVLAETGALHLACANGAFGEAGLSIHWDEALYQRVSQTAGFRNQVLAYFGRFGWPGSEPDDLGLVDRIEAEHRKRFVAAARTGAVALRGDLADFIDLSVEEGWKLAVYTDDHPDLASACVSRLGLQRASAVIVVAGGTEVERGRPDPSAYGHIAERFGVPADACTAIVARPFGAQAARAAGMAFAALVPETANAMSFAGGQMIHSLGAGPEGLGLAA